MCQNDSGSPGFSYPSFEECVTFHGHACPGLATGYRASLAAMKALGVARPYDEELVAIAETDACGVDAIQMVTGCTAGKGNLFIRDYGKHVFTFISRESGRAVRVLVCNPDIPERSEMDDLRKKVFSDNATDDEQQAVLRTDAGGDGADSHPARRERRCRPGSLRRAAADGADLRVDRLRLLR